MKLKRLLASRVFSRVFLSYLALILFLAAMCGVTYGQTAKMSREQLLERSNLVFQSSAQSLKSAFQMVDNQTTNLYEQKSLKRLMMRYGDSSAGDVMEIYETIQSLPTIKNMNDIVSGYFVYIPSLELIVAPGQGFRGIEKYYRSHFSLDPAQPFEDWREKVLESPGGAYNASWRNKSEIQLSVSFFTDAKSGKAVYRINPEGLLRQLSSAYARLSGCALIADAQGGILAVSDGGEAVAEALDARLPMKGMNSGAIALQGEQYVYSSANVPGYGVQMMILIPSSALSAEARASIGGILLILAWMLIIGLIALTLLFISSVLPLSPIVERLSQTGARGHGMSLVSDAFVHMETNNRILEKRLEEQAAHMRNACVNRLLHESEADVYSLEEMLRYSELPIRGSRFSGVLISLGGDQTGEASRAMLLEFLSGFADHLCFLAFDSLRVITCLYFEGENDAVDAHAYFARLYEGLKTVCGAEIEIYVGTPCDALERAPESFQAAAWLMGVSQHNEWLYMARTDAREAAIRAIITPDEEKRLENLALQGDEDRLNQALDEIRKRNFIDKNLQGFHRQYLYCRLIGVCASVLGEDEARQAMPDSLLRMSDAEFFAWLSRGMGEVCRQARDRNSQRSQKLIDSVRAYIEENYAMYDLSLNSLAMRFGITGNYLSAMFKKQLGDNFSQYLEGVRIVHAEALLQETDATIDEIAIRVGYTNSDSFRRAYKRARGISPSQFKTQADKARAVTP